MASKTTTATKPATKEAKPAEKEQKPASGVNINDLAADLGGRSPKSVRAALRKINGGKLPEGVNRYGWPSKSDKGYKDTLKKLSEKAPTSEKADAAS